MTEIKYGLVGKAYLNAILNLSDKSIVSFEIGHSNNNALVLKTFDTAHKKYPDAKSLFHSDRRFQSTPKNFKKLDNSKYVKSSTLYRQQSDGSILGNN